MNQKTFLRPSPLALLSLVAIAATFVVAVMLTRAVPELRVRSFSVNPTAEPLVRGVHARVTAGSVFVERSLPALAFFLEPGQSLDPRLPPGPFEAIFTVTFSPGSVGAARIGAEIRGGSLLINMKGREIATDHAGQEPRLVLSREPIVMGASLRQAVFEFRADGSGPTGLRAMWQPEGSLVPLPMPTGGARLVDDPAVAGLVLAQQMNCSACHRSEDPALMALLSAAPAPLLGQIGARARPAWIHGWLTDPQSARGRGDAAALSFLGERRATDRRFDRIPRVDGGTAQ